MRSYLAQSVLMFLLLSPGVFSAPAWTPDPSIKLSSAVEINESGQHWSFQPPTGLRQQRAPGPDASVVNIGFAGRGLYTAGFTVMPFGPDFPKSDKKEIVKFLLDQADESHKVQPELRAPTRNEYKEINWGTIGGKDALVMTGVYPSGKWFCGRVLILGKGVYANMEWIVPSKELQEEFLAAAFTIH